MSVAFCDTQSLEASRKFYIARSAGFVISFLHKALLAACIVCAGSASSFASPARPMMWPKLEPGALAFFNNADFPTNDYFEKLSSNNFASPEFVATPISATYWSVSNPSAPNLGAMPPSQTNEQGKTNRLAWMDGSAADSIQYVRDVLQAKIAAYQSSLSVLSVTGLQLNQQNADLMGGPIIGAASWYNPFRDGSESPEPETSSGERYDPNTWTAAIQIDLRGQFGGVRYGKNYKPAFVLVESGDRAVIVRINDVGPLKDGRVIDLNERTMRYFDSSLQLGLLESVNVTPLRGEYWTPGPVGGARLISQAVAQVWDAGLVKDEGFAVDARLVKVAAVKITPLRREDVAPNPVAGGQLTNEGAAQVRDAGLVEREGSAVDARFVEADTAARCGPAPDENDLRLPECGSRTVAEFPSARADEGPQADRKLPKVVAAADPCPGWSANANKRAPLGYEITCPTDLAYVAIIAVQASPRIYLAVVRTMRIRTDGRWGRQPSRPAFGTAYNTGGFSGWLIVAVIVPPGPEWEEAQWRDRALSRRVIVSDLKRNLSTRPHVAILQSTIRVRDGPAFV